MPIATRTFRVFVSSTFEDLKEERDALQREVFPKLRTLCAQRGARFQAIDLRWGVRDEAALDQQTMAICLREIQRCKATGVRPNFVALLGDRYGWQPPPVTIPASEFDALRPYLPTRAAEVALQWYRLDENAVPPEYCLQPRTGEFIEPPTWNLVEESLLQALASAARAAALSEKDLIKYEASATHQEILAGLGDSEEDRKHVFGFVRRPTGNTDPRLDALKSHLRVHEFDAGDMKGLCELVLTELTKVILAEVKRFENRPTFDLEIEAHDRFAEDRSRIFAGRQTVLSTIADYIRGLERRPLILHGESGSGKSAVIAKASQKYKGPGRVIRRFIGASPESTSGHALITSLCQQIALDETPVDYAQLENAFRERLKVATAEEPLVLFIDALDQLAAGDPARDVTWLPADLPPHVKVIVSTTDDGSRLPAGLPVRLERMTQSEGGQTLDGLLRGARRTLQPWQHNTVMAHFERCGLPLYLKLAAEESRLWKSYAPEDACTLGEGVAGVIDALFDRLASNANHGPRLVERSLGYLAAARYGLTEDEVLDVLTADDTVWSDFDQSKHHEVSERRLPVVVWSRLLLDLEPYLTERAASGGTVIAFYHRQLQERVPESQARHRDLARYFVARPLADARRCVELVFQQLKAQQWEEAEKTLLDSHFLFAKVGSGMVLDLDADYRGLLQEGPESSISGREVLRLIQGALRLSMHVVAKDPAQFASQIRGRLLAHQFKPRIAALLQDFDACTPRPRLRPLWPGIEAAGGPARRVLEGHTEKVTAVALSGDGKRAVSGSWDCTLRVWDLEGSQPPRILEGHTDKIWAVALKGDGKRAVSASADETLRVWDLEGSRPPRVLKGHTGLVRAVALTGDGRRIVSASDDRTLRVWDLEGDQLHRVLVGHADLVRAVALTDDGRRVVSASDDRTLRVWDLEGSQPPRVLEGHMGWVEAVALSADGKRAVSGSRDHTLRVWDLEDNQPPRVLEGHMDAVWAVAVSGDGKRAVSASLDRFVWIWDLEGNQPPRMLGGHTDWVNSVALSGNGLCAVSASNDHTLRVWDLEGEQPLRVLEGHTALVMAVALSGDGKRLVSGSGDHTLRVWDVEGTQPPRVLEGHTNYVDAVALSGDGKRLVSGSQDHTLRVWDLESSQPPRVLKSHTGFVWTVALSGDGRRAVSGSNDNTLRVWDLEGNQSPRILQGHTGSIWAVALSSDGKRIVWGTLDHALRVWDLEDNKPPRLLEGHTNCIRAVALSGDGARAVSGSDDHTLRVWDLEGNQSPRILKGHTDWVYAVALSGDGRRAASGSKDHTLRVWNLESGECLAVFTCDDDVLSCTWARWHIAAGDRCGQVHLFNWDEAELCAQSPANEPGRTYFPSLERDTAAFERHKRNQRDQGGFTETDRDGMGGLYKSFYSLLSDAAAPTEHRSAAIDLPSPHPAADPERAARLNIEYIRARNEWEQLPWLKRVRTKRPIPPTGI